MINFSDARLLSYQHQHNYLGENLSFNVQKHFTVEGSIYSLDNTGGVIPIWQGISGLVSTAIDYDAVILNGIDFGPGRINNITFTEGNDVRKKDYSADITVFTSGDLSNLTGPNFSGLTLPNIEFTDRFEENFDFTVAEDGTYSYKQSLSVTYVRGLINSDPMDMAKQLASGLFNSTPDYGFIDGSHSGFYNQPGRRTYTESYNQITNECSFSENFTEPEFSGTYAIRYTQEISTSDDGISNLTEKGNIVGLLGTDLMAAATSGLQAELNNTFDRANTVLNTYLPGTLPLNSGFLVLERRINQFTNSIDYSVQYNNDPRNQIFYTWEYTQESSRSNDCYFLIKENGRIKGLTHDCTRIEQFNNAVSGWNIVQTGISGRMLDYYTGTTHLTNPVKYISSSLRQAVHDGSISYDYGFTDDPTYIITGAIKRIETEIQENLPSPLINRFLVPHVGEIAQNLGIVKEGKRNATVRLIGRRGTKLIDSYLPIAQDTMNTLIPSGDDVFIDNCSYDFSPTDNTFSLTVGWVYFGPYAGIFV